MPVLMIGLIFLMMTACSKESKNIPKQPNILLIVADVMGYSDVGAYGSEISTPNIDALAREGVLFTQFHVAPNCGPTRGAMLTGVDSTKPVSWAGKPMAWMRTDAATGK